MGQRAADLATAERGATPTRGRYLVLAGMCSLAVLTYFQRQGFVAGTPYIKRDLGLGDAQIGHLASVWLVAYGLFQVPCGFLGDRLGARRLLTILVLGWSLVAGAVGLAAAFAPGGWQAFAFLVVLRFAFGALQAGGFPGIARVVADWMPGRQRGFAQGMVWTCTRLGGFLAPLVVVWLITEVFGGWAAPCWSLAAVGLLWGATFWLWFRDRPEQTRGVNAAEMALIAADRPATPPRAPLPWSRFLRSRNVWALCLMYGFLGFSGNFITNLLNVYLRDHRRLSDGTTAWPAGLPLGFGISSCLLGGVVSDGLVRRLGSRKWGRRLVGCAATSLAAVAALAPIWVRETWLLSLALSAWMFCNDFTMAPAWAASTDIGERHAGALSGAMNMMGSLFAAVGMSLAGELFQRHLDDLVFVMFGGAYLLAALCWLGVDAARPLVPRPAEA